MSFKFTNRSIKLLMNEKMKSNLIFYAAVHQYVSNESFYENIEGHSELASTFTFMPDYNIVINLHMIQCIHTECSLVLHRFDPKFLSIIIGQQSSEALKKSMFKRSKLYKLICWHQKSKMYDISNVNQVITSEKSNKKIELHKIENCKVEKDKFKKQSHSKVIRTLFNHSNGTSLKKKQLYNDDYFKETDKLQNNFQIEKENAHLFFVAPKSSAKYLLGPVHSENKTKKCCVIDLDETLVHSSFKELIKYDFKITVEIEEDIHEIFIVKRPHVDVFLNKMSIFFECVLFTASLAKYANPVTELLDKNEVFRWRLFRESCVFFKGGFVKDLSMLGRPLEQIVIIDNSPISFMFNPQNAIHITSWYDDVNDRALLDLIPYLQKLSESQTVTSFLRTEPPPSSATFPVLMTSKFPNRPSYLNVFNQNIFESSITNSLITSTNPSSLMKVSSTSSSSFQRKSMINNLPSWRTLFSRSFNPSASDRIILPVQNMCSLKSSSRNYSINTDENEIYNSINPMTQTSSRDNYNKSIKQNLNSALEIFSPRYRQIENRKKLSKKPNEIKYPSYIMKYLMKKNEKQSRFRTILNEN